MNFFAFPDFLNRNIWQVLIVGCLVLVPLRILLRKLPRATAFSKYIEILIAALMALVTLTIVFSIVIQVAHDVSQHSPDPCSQYQSIPVDPRSGFDPMAECLYDYKANEQPWGLLTRSETKSPTLQVMNAAPWTVLYETNWGRCITWSKERSNPFRCTDYAHCLHFENFYNLMRRVLT